MTQPDLAPTDIYVVDDDAAVSQTVSTILSREGYTVTCLADGPSLLRAVRYRAPACILLDIFLPGRSGLDILDDLQAIGCAAPVLIVSGNRNIGMAVESLKRGARDYLEKPFSVANLRCCVREVLSHSLNGVRRAPLNFPGLILLTKREREILEQCINGATVKEAAKALDLSPRTVEDYRSKIIRKLGAKNVADAVRLALTPRQTVESG